MDFEINENEIEKLDDDIDIKIIENSHMIDTDKTIIPL